MVESPIFIVGAPGSGTSLLRDLLRSHPSLAFPSESHFIPTFYRGFGDPRSDREARALAARILRLKWVRPWDLGVEPASLSHCRSYPELISGIYEAFAGRRGRSRWGDMTPWYVQEIPLLLELFPAAKVLHIYRDGRDVANSWIRKPYGPGNVVAGRAYVAAHAGSCLEVRYEDLLGRPEDTMREVCAFIGEDFDRAVLRRTREARLLTRPLIGSRRLPKRASETEIAPSNASKWRRTMSPRNRRDVAPATFVFMTEARIRRRLRTLGRERGLVEGAGSPLAARAFFRDPVGYVRAHGNHSDTLALRAGRSRFVVVRDPESIWRVLVTDAASFAPGKWKRRAGRFLGDTLNTLDGQEHRRRRRLLQPALDPRRVAGFAPAVVARAERTQAAWRDGARIRLRDDIDRLALGIAGEVLLSSELEPRSAELAEALSDVMRALPRLTPPVSGTAAASALGRVDGAIGEILLERRRAGDSEDDAIGVLLRSGLPEPTVHGELTAFLLAAVDEPPSALEAAWYLLGRDPEAEERFHAELDEVLGDRPPRPDDVVHLVYLDAVLKESLRLFPPARHIDRCPVTDVRIGGERVAAGSNVVVSPLVTHHEPAFYDRPDAFVPERWLETGRNERPRGAYLPFGAGVHACIGQPLARSIMTFSLATIGRRWRLRVDRDAPPPTPRAPRLEVTLERR